ncbi:MAG: hypothetical protein ACLRR3_04495 [Eubacterium sp.]
MEMEKILYTNMWDEGKEATATYIQTRKTHTTAVMKKIQAS